MKFVQLAASKAARLPFSDAVQIGDVLYLSGQLGVIPGTMTLAPGGMEPETKQMMENIGRVLNECGLSFANFHDLQEGDVVECFETEMVPG